MKYSSLLVDISDGVAKVSLNRPSVLNAMDEQMMKEITEVFSTLSLDESVRVVILSAVGKGFCAGADLNWMKSMAEFSYEQNIDDSKLLLKCFDSIYKCSKPVVCMVEGYAFGGGLGLISASDIVLADKEKSMFCFSEATLGIIPSVISGYVGKRIAPAKMRKLFLTAERFDANYAYEIGLVDEVLDQDEIEKKINFYVKLLKKVGPQTVSEIKKLVEAFVQLEESDFKMHSVETIARLRVSDEGQEGISAFLQKRKPRWIKESK